MPRGTRRRGSSKNGSDSEDDESYSGEEDLAIEGWFEVDKRIARYCRRLYGKIALGLWELEHEEILDSNVEALANAVYAEAVWVKGKTEADKLWKWADFWTPDYQIRFREKLIQEIYDYIESCSKGRFRKFVREKGTKGFDEIRSEALVVFGGATKAQIEIWEREYDAGLPERVGAAAIPIGCDMRKKLDSLEQRRDLFNNVCPKDKVATYEYANNPKLVKNVIRHAIFFRTEIRELLNDAKLRAEIAGVEVPAEFSTADFSDEWLPTWKKLRDKLISTDDQRKLDANLDKTSVGGGNSKGGIPSMYISPGQHKRGEPTCWKCGKKGHKIPECRKPGNELHSS